MDVHNIEVQPDRLDTSPPWKRGGIGLLIMLAVCAILIATAFYIGTRVAGPEGSAVADNPNSGAWTAVGLRSEPAPDALIGRLRLGRSTSVKAMQPADVKQAVVTQVLVHAGDRISSGDALAVISGRPLILVQNPWPFYRDLHPADSGDDVRALQRILHVDGPSDGSQATFGLATQSALKTFYAHRGFTAAQGDSDSRVAVTEAKRQLAKLTTRDPGSSAPSSTALKHAKDALAKAQLAAGPWLPVDELTTISSSRATVVSAVRVGTVLADGATVANLRTGSPQVVARADALTVKSYSVGANVEIRLTGSTKRLNGTVTKVGPFVAGNGTQEDFPGHDVTIELDGATGMEDGSQVQVGLTDREAAKQIGVPLVALREDGQGSYVFRRDPHGFQQRVPVAVDGQSDGYALVRAPGLRVGDQVRIGSAS